MKQMELTLSLGGELLLVAIDPNGGGLLPRRTRRFRKGVAAAEGLPAGMPLSQGVGAVGIIGAFATADLFAEAGFGDFGGGGGQ
jgi:hypothetical protein